MEAGGPSVASSPRAPTARPDPSELTGSDVVDQVRFQVRSFHACASCWCFPCSGSSYALGRDRLLVHHVSGSVGGVKAGPVALTCSSLFRVLRVRGPTRAGDHGDDHEGSHRSFQRQEQVASEVVTEVRWVLHPCMSTTGLKS